MKNFFEFFTRLPRSTDPFVNSRDPTKKKILRHLTKFSCEQQQPIDLMAMYNKSPRMRVEFKASRYDYVSMYI